MDELIKNPQQLMSQARARPYNRDGEMQGFRLTRVSRKGVPRLLGLERGDVLTSVNGIQLDSIDAALGAFQRLRNSRNLSVTVERKGRTVNKQFTVI